MGIKEETREKQVNLMKKAKIPTPLMKIREVIKEIRIDARTEKVPRIVLKRIVSCIEEVEDKRVQASIEYPLPYILLLSFLAVLSGAETWAEMETFTEAYKTKLNGILPKYKR